MTLELRHLRLFEAVYTSASITRAAERLALSQPTVSVGLGQLRRHFADPLFVFAGQRMSPTPLADALIVRVREVLDGAQQIASWRTDFDPATARRVFTLAMTDASHLTLLPRLFARLRAAAPRAEVVVRPIHATTDAALQTGAVDVAIGFIPGLGPDVRGEVLFPQDWVCLTRRDHPVTHMTLAAYQRTSHVHVDNGTGHTLLLTAAREAGIDRHVALRLPGFLGLPAILSTCDFVATLPRHIGSYLAAIGDLALHECPFAIPGFEVSVHWHLRYETDAANLWLREICADEFARV